MAYENLQDALEQLISDEEYCNKLRFSPGKLALDFGLSEDECRTLQSGNSLNHIDKSIRPVAICCTCMADAVQPTEN